jgi:hypothetical protein
VLELKWKPWTEEDWTAEPWTGETWPGEPWPGKSWTGEPWTEEELRSPPVLAPAHLLMQTTTGEYFFPLIERERWTIGRDASCEIRLLDPLVSRRHAILTCSPDSIFYLIDLGSRNGCMVNEQVLRPMIRLQSGDRLRVGWTELTFYQPEARSTPVPIQANPTLMRG